MVRSGIVLSSFLHIFGSSFVCAGWLSGCGLEGSSDGLCGVLFLEYWSFALVFSDTWCKAYEEVKWGLSSSCTGPRVVDILGDR